MLESHPTTVGVEGLKRVGEHILVLLNANIRIPRKIGVIERTHFIARKCKWFSHFNGAYFVQRQRPPFGNQIRENVVEECIGDADIHHHTVGQPLTIWKEIHHYDSFTLLCARLAALFSPTTSPDGDSTDRPESRAGGELCVPRPATRRGRRLRAP